jgi:hypothetical protein
LELVIIIHAQDQRTEAARRQFHVDELDEPVQILRAGRGDAEPAHGHESGIPGPCWAGQKPGQSQAGTEQLFHHGANSLSPKPAQGNRIGLGRFSAGARQNNDGRPASEKGTADCAPVIAFQKIFFRFGLTSFD